MIKKTIKRAVAVAAVSALPLALAASPASAAGIPNTAVAGTEANTYQRITKEVIDAGGQKFTVSALWTETYKTESGNYRVGLTVRINAVGIDLDTADNPGDSGIDATVRVYQGYADGHTKLIQSRTFDTVSDPFNFNAANPLNRPGGSKVVISAGVDGDGKDNSAPATIVQPVIGDEDPGADGEAEVGDPDYTP
jgi:hypothetical protein